MKKRTSAPFLIALAMILVASACLATLPVPDMAISTLTPNLTTTKLSQFLTSAPRITILPTQVVPTVAMLEAGTPTAFPSITPLPTATPTFTETPFGFVASPTPVPPTDTPIAKVETPDPDEGATDEWGSDYRCSLIAKSPADWTVVPPKGKYKVSWTLLNSGHKNWQADGIRLDYMAGVNLSGSEKTQSLIRDVKVGETITPVINIYPPKEPGHYRTLWALRLIKNGHIFCTFTIKVTVQ